MNLRQLLKFILWRDTTFKGEFMAIRRLLKGDEPQYIVDVGANDGFYSSNSYPFVVRGWRALLIEPHPTAFAKLKKLHASRSNAVCLQMACGEQNGSMQLWIPEDGDTTQATLAPEEHPHFTASACRQSVAVQVQPLSDLLRRHSFPVNFAMLSIDTEGWDLEVLRGLNLNVFRPHCILTEDSARERPDEKRAYLNAHGYQHAAQIGCNSFWVWTGAPADASGCKGSLSTPEAREPRFVRSS